VALGGLWNQRMYRSLTPRPLREKKVLRRVPRWYRTVIRAHTRAARQLTTLVTPLKRSKIKLPTTSPAPAERLKRFYKKAQRRFGVPWTILASVNLIETRMGRLTGPSVAGALGPMQFIPSTWDIYGRGDIMDPHDAIMAAGRYLHARGAPGDMRRALYSYNNSYAYVDAVQLYARQMKRDPRQFFSYYFWQVFVLTTKGDLQWTGPGNGR
jgi:membrane-bound lytic murein transglycosylase B